ncbi:helix-turn-helix domain-containing protein [Spirosoma rigui]|uniref:helix-turn-helix domain-containing protein n=1 Tax=Spirosoma rigui TaxID=564064 RepID=UPI0009AFAB50|nr:helix-turn-helix transcriptional regulator [Spirosoma rigui]
MSKAHEAIRSIRTAKGLKQEEVATKLGMAQSNYARLEKGLTQITVDRLEQLAEVFEMSVAGILSYEVGQQPTTDDINYYINYCKKLEKQLAESRKRVSELEEESYELIEGKSDAQKAAKTKTKELLEKIKDRDRTIQLLEKALDTISKSANPR